MCTVLVTLIYKQTIYASASYTVNHKNDLLINRKLKTRNRVLCILPTKYALSKVLIIPLLNSVLTNMQIRYVRLIYI